MGNSAAVPRWGAGCRGAVRYRILSCVAAAALAFACQAVAIVLVMLGSTAAAAWVSAWFSYPVVMSATLLLPGVAGGVVPGVVIARVWPRSLSALAAALLGLMPICVLLRDGFTWSSSWQSWGGGAALFWSFVGVTLGGFVLAYALVRGWRLRRISGAAAWRGSPPVKPP